MRAAIAEHPVAGVDILPLALDEGSDSVNAQRTADKLLADGSVSVVIGPLSPEMAATLDAGRIAAACLGRSIYLCFHPSLCYNPTRIKLMLPSEDGIIVKGSREGLLITLSLSGAWPTVLGTLETRLTATHEFFKGARVALLVGSRKLVEADVRAARDLLAHYDVLLWGIIGLRSLPVKRNPTHR